MAGKAGASGRPPKSIEQKRSLGITRPDRVPPRDATVAILPAVYDGVVPGPPVHLMVKGQALWRDLLESPWIAKVDLMLVETVCTLADEISEMQTSIEANGLIQKEPIATPKGDVVGYKTVANPLIREVRAAQKHQLELAITLGFSPVARARIGLAEIKKEAGKLAQLKSQLEQRVESG